LKKQSDLVWLLFFALRMLYQKIATSGSSAAGANPALHGSQNESTPH